MAQTNESTRFRLIAVLVAAATIVAGQAIAFLSESNSYWPFTPSLVYAKFPADMNHRSLNVVALTPGGEIDAALIGSVDDRIIHIYNRNLKRAKTVEQEQEILARLHEYVLSRDSEGLQIDGLRVYRIRWDLGIGEIVESELVHEYLKP